MTLFDQIPYLEVLFPITRWQTRTDQSTIIDTGLQLDHLTLFLEQWNEGQKVTSLQTILVEVIGRSVRGGHHHHATSEEFLEEVTQYHGVANVGHLELVQTQQPRVLDYLVGDVRDWVELKGWLVGRVTVIHLVLVKTIVKVKHEGVEVDAFLERSVIGR